MSDPNNSMNASSQLVRLYITAILILCFILVLFVLAITFIRPLQDNTQLIGVMIGVFTPAILGVMALVQKENHSAMNSRLSELLALTEKSAKAEGKLEGNQ